MHHHVEQLWLIFVAVPNQIKSCYLLIPCGFRCGDYVRCNVSNVFVGKTSSEGRHGILSVGDLCHDCFLITSSSKVLIKSFLLKGLVGHDDILSSSMACGTVCVEHLFTGSNVSCECWGNSNSGNNGGGSSSLCDLGGLLSNRECSSGSGDCGEDSKLHFDEMYYWLVGLL